MLDDSIRDAIISNMLAPKQSSVSKASDAQIINEQQQNVPAIEKKGSNTFAGLENYLPGPSQAVSESLQDAATVSDTEKAPNEFIDQVLDSISMNGVKDILESMNRR